MFDVYTVLASHSPSCVLRRERTRLTGSGTNHLLTIRSHTAAITGSYRPDRCLSTFMYNILVGQAWAPCAAPRCLRAWTLGGGPDGSVAVAACQQTHGLPMAKPVARLRFSYLLYSHKRTVVDVVVRCKPVRRRRRLLSPLRSSKACNWEDWAAPSDEESGEPVLSDAC